ncbi:MAG TPA: ester cyclase [Solirubrobacteraceae bacterium]|nr:ester cyclase [Solirubrobacteraceae bacterium]
MTLGPRLEDLLDRWQAGWSGGERDAFAQTCAPDVHYEDPIAPQPLEGVEAIAAHARLLRRTFPDARVERTGERLTDGRYVAAPCKVLGTHRGEIEGLSPTGRFLVVHVVFYCELDAERERLWRVRAFFDAYDAAVQLGVLPARGTFSERALLMLRGFGLRSRT